ERGEPLHEAGIGHEKGLYFVGHHFLYSMTSDTIPGVGRDAARVARHILNGRAATRGPSDVRAMSARAR
ncbi:MAG: hypothetical protein ACXVQV_08920, partial [Actinomycetota bacterium]